MLETLYYHLFAILVGGLHRGDTEPLGSFPIFLQISCGMAFILYT